MKVSEVLREAKGRILKHGWTTGNTGWMGGTAPRCAIGALLPESYVFNYLDSKHGPCPSTVAEKTGGVYYLKRALRERPDNHRGFSVWAWNDDQKSPKPVLDLYDRAIALAEEDEAKAKVTEMIAELEAWANQDPPPVAIKKGVDIPTAV